ncbi:MAG: hypothetical protein ACW99U_14615 [Candidatus Thorarchaeota archaeon]
MTTSSSDAMHPKKEEPVFTLLKPVKRIMSPIELYVKGNRIPMNEFVNNVIHDVMMALLSHLRDMELDEIKRIDIT